MSIAIMSETFGQPIACGDPAALSIRFAECQFAEWMGRLKVKPGSLIAAESRPPSR